MKIAFLLFCLAFVLWAFYDFFRMVIRTAKSLESLSKNKIKASIDQRMLADRKTHWITNDGRVIAIKDLTDKHLSNIINFLHDDNPHKATLQKEVRRRIDLDNLLTEKPRKLKYNKPTIKRVRKPRHGK